MFHASPVDPPYVEPEDLADWSFFEDIGIQAAFMCLCAEGLILWQDAS